MGWIIFKGIHSSQYDVMVLKQPPISKPPLRHDLITVDGMDGDIIEPLGYDGYKKTVEIFLDDPERIDEVIDWLSGEGQLICSQEKDKYYEAYVLEQIDYERLAMYRKASVSFHVQPYKYLRGEEKTTSTTVINYGNVDALPLMTVYGSGTVTISINGTACCTLTISEYMTLDSAKGIAYKDNVMCNRLISGTLPILEPGENIISYTGIVTSIETLVRSRFR